MVSYKSNVLREVIMSYQRPEGRKCLIHGFHRASNLDTLSRKIVSVFAWIMDGVTLTDKISQFPCFRDGLFCHCSGSGGNVTLNIVERVLNTWLKGSGYFAFSPDMYSCSQGRTASEAGWDQVPSGEYLVVGFKSHYILWGRVGSLPDLGSIYVFWL